VRVETVLNEKYCPPLTASTLRKALEDAARGELSSGITYAAKSGEFLTIYPSEGGKIEMVAWGFNANDPNADGLGKYERRSIFSADDLDHAIDWAANQVEMLDEASRKQKPVALNKLRYNEPLERARRAKNVGLKFEGERRGTDKKSGKYRAFKFTAGEHEARYNVEVRVFWENGAKGTSPAWVMCTCPDHRYSWEWSLAKRNSSSLRHAKNERPDIRNPRLLKATCKHVHAALEWLRWERGL